MNDAEDVIQGFLGAIFSNNSRGYDQSLFSAGKVLLPRSMPILNVVDVIVRYLTRGERQPGKYGFVPG